MKYKIYRKRRRYQFIPGNWNSLSQTNELVFKNQGRYINKSYVLYEKPEYIVFFEEQEEEKIKKEIFSNILSNPLFITEKDNKQEVVILEIKNFIEKLKEKDLNKSNLKELLEIYSEIYQNWIKIDTINVFPWIFGADLLSQHITNILKSKEIDENTIKIILTNPKPSFSMEEEKDFNKFLLTGKEEDAISLSEKYYWVAFGYDGPLIYDKTYYLNKFKEEPNINTDNIKKRIHEIEQYESNLNKEQDKLFKKYNLDQETLRLIKDFHKLNDFNDKRKSVHFPLHIEFAKVLKQICNKINISYEEGKHLLLEEIKISFLNPEKLKEIAKKRTENLFIFIAEFPGKYKFIYGEEAEKIKQELKQGDIKEIKGYVASKTDKLVQGKAKILFNAQELSKVEKGDIIFSTMTTPEFVSAMRKAAGIVTDEGGITCHAAIISRELGIPCIIGTKVGTDIIQDNDFVELDTNTGIIRRIQEKID